ncbi:hypothetical protein [Mesobacillus zeae]|uniref:hypothetical protein n=1 Tax=Mesobacillus zeae TaxID=1917180 RepID=UPI00300B86B4
MEDIMIINDKIQFREGLKKIFEFKFGHLFRIVDTDSKKLSKYKDTPKLIVIERISNQVTEFILEMHKKGSKVVLLSFDPENIQRSLELDIFNGFLLKNMPTRELLNVIEEIIDQDKVYVHPDIGYLLLQKLKDK